MLLTFKPTGNGKWFAVLETHAEVRQFGDTVHHQPRVSMRVWLQLLGHMYSIIEENWQKYKLTVKNQDLVVLKYYIQFMCRLLDYMLKGSPVQIHLAASSWRDQRRLTSCYVFSAGMQG